MSARVSKPVGQAVCAAAILGAALDTLKDSDALTTTGRKQAEKAHRWFRDAVFSSLNGHLPDVTRRKTMAHAPAAARLADKIMPDAITYAPFITARILAAWTFIEHQCVHNRELFGREWRYLLQTTWTFLVMIWPDVEQEEARISRFADEMFMEFAA